jgi:hypothetical protein
VEPARINPYQVDEGPELDRFIHCHLFKIGDESGTIPAYSSDESASAKVKARLRALRGHAVLVGPVRGREKKYFARLESDPSTSTECIARTQPLALCRLAAVLLRHRA